MRRDRFTPDLFKDFEPAPVVPRFEDEEVRAWSPARSLSRAIALTLDEDGRSREEIAEALSEQVGEKVSKVMLDAYASQEKVNAISALRLIGLVAVTGDARTVNLLLAEAGLIAVDAKYEALLRREMADEAIQRMTAERDAAAAEWKAKHGRARR